MKFWRIFFWHDLQYPQTLIFFSISNSDGAFNLTIHLFHGKNLSAERRDARVNSSLALPRSDFDFWLALNCCLAALSALFAASGEGKSPKSAGELSVFWEKFTRLAFIRYLRTT